MPRLTITFDYESSAEREVAASLRSDLIARVVHVLHDLYGRWQKAQDRDDETLFPDEPPEVG